MKNMNDPHFKNVIIFILFILILFFISNDKNFNKIFQKNIIKLLFLFTLIYMVYLKVNMFIIFGIFFIFILFNTNVGKKLQKNKYIKKIIKYFSPYITPIINNIEDIIYSFTNIPDDDNSIKSNNSKKVSFEEDELIDYDEVDDIELIDENEEYDLLDEIRKDMIPNNDYENENNNNNNNNNNNDIEDATLIEDLIEDETEITTLKNPSEIKELYNEISLIKEQLKEE